MLKTNNEVSNILCNNSPLTVTVVSVSAFAVDVPGYSDQ